MADFKIVKPEPFVVEGVNGTYELPRLQDLDAEQVAALAPLGDAQSPQDRCVAVRNFFPSLCPELADEPIRDMGYVSLFNALSEGSGISVGEF